MAREVTCLASASTGKSGQSETAHSVEERGEQGRAIVTWTTSCTLSSQQPSHKATIQRDVPLRLGWSTTSLGRMAPSTSERRIQTKEEGGQTKRAKRRRFGQTLRLGAILLTAVCWGVIAGGSLHEGVLGAGQGAEDGDPRTTPKVPSGSNQQQEIPSRSSNAESTSTEMSSTSSRTRRRP